jgi:hypothetical protein
MEGAAPHARVFARPPECRAGGPYGWVTPYVSTIAASNAGVAARLLSLPRDDLHFIAMALAFMTDAREDELVLQRFAQALGRVNREAILRDFAPTFDPRIARLCGKLAGKPWRAASYLRLAELMDEPHARKTLLHLKAISRRDLIALARLPFAFRTRAVLKMAIHRRDFREVLFAIEIVRRVRTDLTDRQILRSLENADPTFIKDWVEAHYERLPFPAAPTGVLADGRGGVLRPVVCGADLRRAAIDFDNCARGYVARAATGASVFYRCERGDQRIALAELRPAPGFIWAVCQLRGPKNRELGGDDRSAILAAFAAAGIAATPQAKSPFGWFFLE